jgi:hypothetical protein
MLNVLPIALVQVKDQLHLAGFMCDVDVDPGDTMNKKIRNAQLAQYNFILGKLSLSWSLQCVVFVCSLNKMGCPILRLTVMCLAIVAVSSHSSLKREQ